MFVPPFSTELNFRYFCLTEILIYLDLVQFEYLWRETEEMLQILEDADSYFYDLVEVYRNIGAREMDAGDLESLVGNLEDISEFLIKMQRAVVNAFYRA